MVAIIEVGIQGPPGPPGSQGVGSDRNYVHTQNSISTTWVVNHNLGKWPCVTIVDSAGTEFEADVVHNSMDQLTIHLAIASTGLAYVN